MELLIENLLGLFIGGELAALMTSLAVLLTSGTAALSFGLGVSTNTGVLITMVLPRVVLEVVAPDRRDTIVLVGTVLLSTAPGFDVIPLLDDVILVDDVIL